MFPEFKGVVIYGSFPKLKSRPNDVDLMLVYERDYMSGENGNYSIDKEYSDRIERTKRIFRDLNPLYHVNNSVCI